MDPGGEAVNALGVQDVAWVAWKVDGGLTVQVWPRNRIEPIEQLTKALGARPSEYSWAEHPPHPPLSTADWRVIDVLLDDPRIDLEGLCKATGLSPKTVRKHLGTMIRDETIYITPKLGVLADSGDLVYHLAVYGRVGFNELKLLLGDVVLVNETKEPPMSICSAEPTT